MQKHSDSCFSACDGRGHYGVGALVGIRVVGFEALQVGLRKGKFCESTIEADYRLREHEHRPFVYAFSSGKMNVHLHPKLFLIVGSASLTGHNPTSELSPLLFSTEHASEAVT